MEAKKKQRTTISEIDLYTTSPGHYSLRSFIQTGRDAMRTLRRVRSEPEGSQEQAGRKTEYSCRGCLGY